MMRRFPRFLCLLLTLLLLLPAVRQAEAEIVTLGIRLSGVTEDESTVQLSGRFRVWQNGQIAGTIEANGETLTLDSTERIRIEPVPESVDPGWDLTDAGREVIPEGSGTVMVPVVLHRVSAEALAALSSPVPEATLTPEPVPEIPLATPAPTMPDGSVIGDDPAPNDILTPAPEADDESAGPAATAVVRETSIPLPTAPEAVLTPEPELISLPQTENGGTLRVFAFYDGNSNGWFGPYETPVSGITVYLLDEAGNAVGRAETGENGEAVFTGLPAGSYQTRVFLPDDWAFTEKGAEGELEGSAFSASPDGDQVSSAFEVRAGAESLQGVGVMKAVRISGFAWLENSADGIYAKGEPMLPGVRVTLDGTRNGMHYETVTGADGTWRIDHIRPAMYDITAYVPDGLMFAKYTTRGGNLRSYITRDGVRQASRSLDLNTKEDKNDIYFGFTQAAQITGRVYQDANYNGLYDEGELPMKGVKVTAIRQLQDEEVAATVTDENGLFTLTGLRGNTYKVRVLLPDDGCNFTRLLESEPMGNHFKARPDRRENFWKDFVLEDRETREIAVGVIYPATVTGTVYLDDDFSATLNGKEKIVTSFQVDALDEKGQVAASDRSNIKGMYEITGLAPGSYSLRVTAIKGYAFTRLGEQNVILNRTGGEGYTEPFAVALGEKITGKDIGMIRPGTVRGSVFADANDNGLRDAGEAGLPGVIVRLMGEDGEAFRAVIDETGSFLFDAVMPGTWTLEYELPENAVFAQTPAGGNTITSDGRIGRGEPFPFVTAQEVDAPLCGALTLGAVEGTAFADHDGDGLRGEGEETLAGVQVMLTPARADLQEITATTDETGAFSLTGLHPDHWTLRVLCPEGYAASRTDHLSLPLEPGKQDQSQALPVAMGATWKDQALGVIKPASLSGRLWLDENNNGTLDEGEKTPAGYAVTVTDEYTGKTFETLISDEQGGFATSGLIPGSYTVSFPLDERTIAPKAGDCTFTEENGRLVMSHIALKEGETTEGLTLGIVRYTAIRGTAWIDRGETMENLAGVTVTLLDENGQKAAETVTGESGSYAFTGLMPGRYTIRALMPEGCVIIEPDDSRLAIGNLRSVIVSPKNREGDSTAINLRMAEDMDKMDIGAVLPSRMGDRAWLDLDGDGLQGMNEPGLPHVSITLLRGGEVIAETTTDQYGFWRFSDLYPAAYTLQVTAPQEVKPTRVRTDIRMIASVLQEAQEGPYITSEIVLESDKANYNADLGFVLRQEGVLPAGIGEAEIQDWTKK